MITSRRYRYSLLLWLLLSVAAGPAAQGDGDFSQAPDFPDDLSWLNVERPLSMKALRGKVVILDFWTYGCINCIHVMEELDRLKARYGNALAVIAVHTPKFENEGNLLTLEKILHRYGRDDPVVNDPEYRMMSQYAVRAWPTLAVIDPLGRYVGKVSGEGHEERLTRAIDALLARHQERIDRSPLPLSRPQPRTESLLDTPAKIAVGGDRVAISDVVKHRILVTDPKGSLQLIIGDGTAGFEDGDLSTARFRAPRGLAFGADGALYVADTGNHAIRHIDLTKGRVRTLAGTGRKGNLEPGSATKPRAIDLRSPWDLTVDDGALYIAMAGDHRIWRMDLVTTELAVLAGSGHEGIRNGDFADATFSQPSDLALDGRHLYVADAEASAIRRLDLTEKKVATPIGTGLFDFGDRDGPMATALLQHPLAVTLWHNGNLLVADTYNHKIKSLDLKNKTATTLLGDGRPGEREANGRFRLNEPGGLAVLGYRLLIADSNNGRILSFSPDTAEAQTWPLRDAR